MSEVTKVTELSLETPDKAGVLDAVAGALECAGVNIEAICGCACKGTNTAYIMLVPDKAPKAQKALAAAGFRVTKSDVLMVEMPNKIGMLACVGAKAKAAGVSLSYLYASTAGKTGRVVVASSDLAKLAKALKK